MTFSKSTFSTHGGKKWSHLILTIRTSAGVKGLFSDGPARRAPRSTAPCSRRDPCGSFHAHARGGQLRESPLAYGSPWKIYQKLNSIVPKCVLFFLSIYGGITMRRGQRAGSNFYLWTCRSKYGWMRGCFLCSLEVPHSKIYNGRLSHCG